uniref:uncharacterized protein LOC122610601 n=1 Tax=Erigeron canadensis TaxID=72917 RepID=UPI001CB894B4|nr:uncharacterized protein LOC122610601 [Erigeron canadensis]
MNMKSKVKANFRSMKGSPKDSKKKVNMQMQLVPDQKSSLIRGVSEKDRKMALQHDIEKLKKRLTEEEDVHRALEWALNRPLEAHPGITPNYLPPETLKLLGEVAVLEKEIARLEEQVVKVRQDLYQETIFTSFFNNNVDNSSDFQEKCLTRDPISTIPTSFLPRNPNIERAKTLSKRSPVDYLSAEECLGLQKLQENGISRDDSPNKISESTLKCLMFVFARMNTTSTLKISEMLPSIESCENPWAMDFMDPYDIFYEFENTDIGPYKYIYEVKAATSNANQITISVLLAQRLKTLLGKLASVNLTSLTHQEKLAFWINIYNSCMMNAFLELGIPETPDRVVQLMQEAKINVGGHLLNAFSIEHFILRLPCHTKYSFTKDFTNNEATARSLFGLELSEPRITFALSCGSWSSPAVRVYNGAEVENELEAAKRDYLQAAVGISSTNKVLAIPKLLDWYMLDFAKDTESFVEWVCLQLPSEVRNVAIKCLERNTSEPLSGCVRVSPYDFHFRYLFYK